MFAVLRRRAFRRLWLGETVSLVGDWLSYVALALLALEQTGGAWTLAVIFAGHVLPTAMVSPFAGVVIDRVDPRKALITVQLVQAVAVLAMLAGVAEGALLVVEVMLFFRTSVASFFYPAKQAALRQVVATDELLDANALDAATWSVTFAVGTALGGLLALMGPVVALSVDAATFVLAAGILGRLPPMPPMERSAEKLVSLRGLTRDLGAALRAAAVDRRLLEAVFAKTPVAFASGAAWILLNLTAFDISTLGSSALALGFLQAVRGVGSGVGPMVAKRVLASGVRSTFLLRGSTVLVLLAIVGFGVASTAPASSRLAWVAVTAFLWGVGDGSNWVFSATEIQRRAPSGTLGRLSAVDQFCFTAARSGAALIAGYLVQRSAVALQAAWISVVGASSLVMLVALVIRRTNDHRGTADRHA